MKPTLYIFNSKSTVQWAMNIGSSDNAHRVTTDNIYIYKYKYICLYVMYLYTSIYVSHTRPTTCLYMLLVDTVSS